MIDPTLHALLVDRLDTSDLDGPARAEVLGATGTAGPSPGTADAGTTREVYLRSITVEGFRGIGPAATLSLDARPGLTVVVGRNGSGKSSFAEGLELLATGTTKRWESRTKGWQSAWQCLHSDAPTRVAAELVIAGRDEPVSLEQTWAPGVAHTDDAGRASVRATLAAHGWDHALSSFRPFLAYAELASMFDKLTSLYDALSPILGLEDVDEVLRRLSEERLALETRAKTLKPQATALRASLDRDEPRQAALAALLEARRPDPAAVRAFLDAHPPGAGQTDDATAALRRVAFTEIPDDAAIEAAHAARDATIAAAAELATTDAARALATAELLVRALALHDAERPAEDCPVCATSGVLDAAWAERARTEAELLRERATALAAAEAERDAAVADWRALATGVVGAARPAAAADLPSVEAVLAGAAEARTRAAEARAALAEQDTTWRARTEAATVWVAAARAVDAEASRLAALKAAETWLKAEADALRNERFAPIARQAMDNWELLRHESNVALHDITLRTVGRRREATFDVRADGQEANAIGVMSQGELLALSVSVFLPRAGLDESPFRFAVIDDPVQSMDPAKVDGLARVLALAARTRQVVVFTHDDRLPEAIRRLKLPASVLQVHRRARSQVSVSPSRTPLTRHLVDAKTIAKSDRVPEDVRRRVVPTLCRSAVEAACAELVRAKVVQDGRHPSDADEDLLAARTLRDQLSLALLGDADRHAELRDALVRRGGPDAPALVTALNAGAHGDYDGSLLDLQRRTSEVLVSLMQSA